MADSRVCKCKILALRHHTGVHEKRNHIPKVSLSWVIWRFVMSVPSIGNYGVTGYVHL